jgi:glycosyl hydrolase family 26
MLCSTAAIILTVPLYLATAVGTPQRVVASSGHAPQCGAVSVIYVPTCGAWFGTTGAPDLPTAEAIDGRTADIYHEYKTFASYAGTKPFPGATAQAAINDHHMYFFSWKPNLADGRIVPWNNIADGKADAAYVDVLARKIRDWSAAHPGEKVFMAFHHEPEDNIGPYGAPADYARAWRHISDRFTALGARSSLIFVWVVTGYKSWVADWNELYPGDDVIDWLAWDPYGRTPSDPAGSAITRFATSLGEDAGSAPDATGSARFYKWATGAGAVDQASGRVFVKRGAHDKPLMLSEFGVCWSSNSLSQAEKWYADAAKFIGSGRYPLVRAFVHFAVDRCLQPLGSPTMLENFRAAVSPPRLRQPRPY